MNIKDIIHIMDKFAIYGRTKDYEVDYQISSNKDFYVYITTKNYKVEVSFHQYSDDITRVSIDVSRGLVTMTWGVYDNATTDTIDFEYIMANAACLIDSFNLIPETVYNPPKGEVDYVYMKPSVEDRDWWD